ncbi:restriction endonuclease subunit S [Polaribacter sp. Q13]|uniref:restriction endonuclease subunit S n=1 Tax=Polaribacter sp. Q13 TaxID=2806551 RepID=UPI00193B84BB|nr:restriction endonuclease subunit S [Polaribacter sp. Q13]QVY67107.1 restriction endonuclease subunit S [Polaribacter sp. Q13]
MKTYKLSDLYEMSSGISSKKEQAGHGSPFASFSTVFNNTFLPDVLPDLMDTSEKEKETYSIKVGDIFLTRTSETLDELGMSSVAVKDYPNASYSGFLKRLRPTQKNITYAKFMAFYLRSYLFRKTMNNNATMTLRASLNEQIFSYLDIVLPEYNEQIKIGDLFHKISQKIEINNKINQELEAIAKTLYDYWFVQFDFPDANGKPYKSSGGKMVFNEELKRETPVDWEVGRLDDICNIINGYAFKSEWYKESGVKIIRTKNFEDGYVNLNDINYLEKEFALEFEKYQLNQFDFLMVMVGASTGKNCIVNSNILPALQNQNMWRFVSKTNSQLFLNLKLKRTILELESTTNGSARGFFQKSTFLKKKIEIPNENLIRNLCKKVNPIFQKIDNNLKENQKLSELRDWLLPMLMNGQITVGGAEKEIERLGLVAEESIKYGER